MKNIFFVTMLYINFSVFGQTTKEEFIEIGLKQHANSNYEKAIDSYTKALNIDPDLVAGFVNRSNVYFEKKEYFKALLDINKALKLNPDLAKGYNNRGLIYKFQNKYTEAIVDYNKAISIDGNYIEPYINKIRVLLLLNKPNEAKLIVANLKKEFTDKTDIYLVAYIYATLKNDFSTALVELNTAVKIDPKNENVLYERAMFKNQINDKKGAVLDYSSLLELNPKEAKYFYGRSSANYDLKEYDKVIEDCEKAISLDENYYSAYSMLGDVYDTKDKMAIAINNYEKAISIRPNFEHAYNELAKIYFFKKEYSKAIEVLDRILIIDPNLISSLEFRADFKEKKLDYEGSISDYEKLIRLDSKNSKYYLLKAQVENDFNKKENACSDMKIAKRLQKNQLTIEFAAIHNYLFKNCRSSFSTKILKVDDLNEEAFSLYKEKKIDLTIKKYDEMIRIVPDSAFLYYNRGKFNRELKRHEAAIVDYKKVIQLDKKNTEAWVALGVSQLYMLKLEDAKSAFLNAIKSDPNYAMSYHNIALIYSKEKNYLKAIEYFEMAIQKDTNYTNAYLELAMNYLKINEKNKACYNFKRAEALGSIPALLKKQAECQ